MIRWTGVLQEDRNRFMLLLEYAQYIYLPYWYLYLRQRNFEARDSDSTKLEGGAVGARASFAS